MKTVLIVMKDHTRRNGLSVAIVATGQYQTIACATAENAYQYLKRADAIITDYVLSGMSGAQLAEVAKREKPSIPIMLVKENSNSSVPNNHLADKVISKENLFRNVCSWLAEVLK